MADEKFKTFKKRYQEGKITTTQMPPLPAGPAGVGRQIAGAAAGTGLRAIRDAFLKQQKNAARNAKRREAAAQKREVEATKKAERAKEKFGPLAKREENLPATQGSRSVVKRKDNLPATRGSDSRALTVAREGKGDLVRTGGGRSVATTGPRTFGDKGQSGRIVGLSNKGKLAAGALAAGAAGAAYSGYKKSDTASAEKKKDNDFARTGPIADAKRTMKNMPIIMKGLQEDARTPGSKSVGGTKNGPFKSEFAKKSLQGRKTGASVAPSAPASKTASDKSRLNKSSAKMSNFERMKARGYEKEGYGGRSMTAKSAKEQVKKERGFKFKDLFKK